MWGQNLPDGESPSLNGRCGRTRRHLPAHEHRRLHCDIHLSSTPSRGLPGERTSVVDAHLQTGPQRPTQACRIGQAVAENRLELAEDRPPFRLRVHGKEMTVKRRIPVSGRYLAHKPVSDGSHEPYLGKSFTHLRQYEHAPVDRQRDVSDRLRGLMRRMNREWRDLPATALLTSGSASGPAGCSRDRYRAVSSRSPAARPPGDGGPPPARRPSPRNRPPRRPPGA